MLSARTIAYAVKHGLIRDATSELDSPIDLSCLPCQRIDLQDVRPRLISDAWKRPKAFDKTRLTREHAAEIAGLIKSVSSLPDPLDEWDDLPSRSITLPEPKRSEEVVTSYALFRKTCRLEDGAWLDELYPRIKLDPWQGPFADEEELRKAEEAIPSIDQLLDIKLKLTKEQGADIWAIYQSLSKFPPFEDKLADPILPPGADLHLSPKLFPRHEEIDVLDDELHLVPIGDMVPAHPLPMTVLNTWNGLPARFSSPSTVAHQTSPLVHKLTPSLPTTPAPHLEPPLMRRCHTPPTSSPVRSEIQPVAMEEEMDKALKQSALSMVWQSEKLSPAGHLRIPVPKLLSPARIDLESLVLQPVGGLETLTGSLAWSPITSRKVDTLGILESEALPLTPPASPMASSEVFQPPTADLNSEDPSPSPPLSPYVDNLNFDHGSSSPARDTFFLESKPENDTWHTVSTELNEPPIDDSARHRFSIYAKLSAFHALRQGNARIPQARPAGQAANGDFVLDRTAAQEMRSTKATGPLIRCVASFRLLQHPVASALQNFFELIEWPASLPIDGDLFGLRDFPDLVIDGTTCISFLLLVKLRAEHMVQAVRGFEERWGFDRQLVILVGPQTTADTPTIRNELALLKERELELASIKVEMAPDSTAAATLAQRFALARWEECAASDGLTAWSDAERKWLKEDLSEDAYLLESNAGLHLLAAQAIVAKYSLQDLFDMSQEERLDYLQGIIGSRQAMSLCNTIEENKQAMMEDT